MNIIAILQARTSSTRLPYKVLRPILGVPMLTHQINRILKSKLIDKLLVATSNEPSDNELTSLVTDLGIDVYRGSLNNVLDRFYHAAEPYKPSHVVRITGDCPLLDSEVIDKVIQKHIETKSDYTSNVTPPTFPDGMDVEIMTFTALKQAWKNVQLNSDKEHVTPYIKNHPELFKIENYDSIKDYSHMRWTVDEPEDFEFAEAIYSELYYKNKNFTYSDILKLIEQKKHIEKINNKFARNEGYLKSLKKDGEKDLK